MNKDIDYIKKTRQFLLNTINDLSVDQLNEIPAGFNNNIIWNLAHLVAAQQGICYMRAGAPITVEEKYFTEYKPGTKPGEYMDATEVQKIKDLMLLTLDRLTSDHETNVFDNYPAWTTRTGPELSSVDDALAFILYHEGLHTGAIMDLKKMVSK